jgi:2-keto-4-pentenoate hydratase/2-oxohepta-3-ene-1,7-dioic acid hydratase in catechol pathway
MRLLRYQFGQNQPRYGWALAERLGPIEGSIFAEFHRLEVEHDLDEVKILPPILPSKIICVGKNYAAHAKELSTEVPELPLLFQKPPSAVIGPGDTILLPPQSQQVEHEAELVAVVGKRGRWIQPQDVFNYLLGFTIGNDVTARDLQQRDLQWTRAKGFDTFCPIGPWIETEFDPSDALINCFVNDEMRQMSSTQDMVFNVRQLIAFVSSVMTLEPGDILFTGTPAGVGPLHPGDIVKITIEGLGTLQNPVANQPEN